MFKKPISLKFVKGDLEKMPPWYYGLSMRYLDKFATEYHVIPINYVMRFWYWVKYSWDIFRSGPSFIDRKINQIVDKEVRRTRDNMISIMDARVRNVHATVDKLNIEYRTKWMIRGMDALVNNVELFKKNPEDFFKVVDDIAKRGDD